MPFSSLSFRPVLLAAALAALLAGHAAGGGDVSWRIAAVPAVAALLWLAGGGRHVWLGPALAGIGYAALFLTGAGSLDPWPAALAFGAYGAAFALIARGEAWRGALRPAYAALGLGLAAVALPVLLGFREGFSGMAALPFALLLAWRMLPDLLWAASDPRPVPVRAALSSGGTAAAALGAAVAAGFAGPMTGLAVLFLLPVGVLLERHSAAREVASERRSQVTRPERTAS